ERRHHAAIRPCGLEGRNRLLHQLQHNLGRADVSPQSMCRRESARTTYAQRYGLLARGCRSSIFAFGDTRRGAMNWYRCPTDTRFRSHPFDWSCRTLSALVTQHGITLDTTSNGCRASFAVYDWDRVDI